MLTHSHACVLANPETKRNKHSVSQTFCSYWIAGGRGGGCPFSRSDPDYQASMWEHMSGGQKLIWAQESFPGGLDGLIKNFHQDRGDSYGVEQGKAILSVRGSWRNSLRHEKLVGLEWTEIIMTVMNKIQDRGIRVDLERKSGWTSGVTSRIFGFTLMAMGLLAKSSRRPAGQVRGNASGCQELIVDVENWF